MLFLHLDQDSVYTSYDWTGRLLRQDKARLSYTLNGGRDNSVIVSFFGRIKMQRQSCLLAADDLDELERLAAERVDYYNRSRRHSSLDYRTPLAVLRQMRLDCRGAVDLPVDSLDTPNVVTHPDHRPATG